MSAKIQVALVVVALTTVLSSCDSGHVALPCQFCGVSNGNWQVAGTPVQNGCNLQSFVADVTVFEACGSISAEPSDGGGHWTGNNCGNVRGTTSSSETVDDCTIKRSETWSFDFLSAGIEGTVDVSIDYDGDCGDFGCPPACSCTTRFAIEGTYEGPV